MVVVYEILECRHTDDVTGKMFFFILSNKLLGFESCCEIISNLASKVLEKSLSRAFYKKKEKPETKSILGDLKWPQLEEIF